MTRCTLLLRPHRWQVAGAQQVSVYDGPLDSRPVSDHTVVLRRCQRCGHASSYRIEGRWSAKELTR